MKKTIDTDFYKEGVVSINICSQNVQQSFKIKTCAYFVIRFIHGICS